MKVIGDHYDVNTKEHEENTQANLALNRELDYFVEQTQIVPQREREKMQQKGKFDPFDRIDQLIDRGSPFLEIAMLAGHDQGVPAGNLVAGIGVVNG